MEGQTAGDEKYINNAELSQKRSYQVLNYVYLLPAIEPHRKWLRPLFFRRRFILFTAGVG